MILIVVIFLVVSGLSALEESAENYLKFETALFSSVHQWQHSLWNT